jgi:hypothetical protein
VFSCVAPKQGSRHKDPSIWEEGGRSFTAGHVLLVADNNGEPKSANAVFFDDVIVNGRHALIPLRVEDFIVIGYTMRGISLLCVYVVTGIQPATPDRPRMTARGELYASILDGNITYQENVGSDPVITLDSPLIKAAIARLNEHDAKEPAFIRKYNKRRFDTGEFQKWVADEEFMGRLKDFKSLKAAYASLKKAMPSVKLLGRGEQIHLSTVLDVAGDDLYAFVYGTVFDTTTVSSASGASRCSGRYFNGRVKLDPSEDIIFIDDYSKKFNYDQVKNRIKEARAKGEAVIMSHTVRQMMPD